MTIISVLTALGWMEKTLRCDTLQKSDEDLTFNTNGRRNNGTHQWQQTPALDEVVGPTNIDPKNIPPSIRLANACGGDTS